MLVFYGTLKLGFYRGFALVILHVSHYTSCSPPEGTPHEGSLPEWEERKTAECFPATSDRSESVVVVEQFGSMTWMLPRLGVPVHSPAQAGGHTNGPVDSGTNPRGWNLKSVRRDILFAVYRKEYRLGSTTELSCGMRGHIWHSLA